MMTSGMYLTAERNLTASSILIEKEMSEYRREGMKIGNKGKANISSSEVVRAQTALSIVRVRTLDDTKKQLQLVTIPSYPGVCSCSSPLIVKPYLPLSTFDVVVYSNH